MSCKLYCQQGRNHSYGRTGKSTGIELEVCLASSRCLRSSKRGQDGWSGASEEKVLGVKGGRSPVI